MVWQKFNMGVNKDLFTKHLSGAKSSSTVARCLLASYPIQSSIVCENIYNKHKGKPDHLRSTTGSIWKKTQFTETESASKVHLGHTFYDVFRTNRECQKFAESLALFLVLDMAQFMTHARCKKGTLVAESSPLTSVMHAESIHPSKIIYLYNL